MSLFWVDPHSVAYPDLLCLTDLDTRVPFHKSYLSFKLAWVPQIVRVPKGQVCAPDHLAPELRAAATPRWVWESTVVLEP